MSFETDASHIHYEPLLKERCEHECIANCHHLTIRPNKKHKIDYPMVNEIPSAKSRSKCILLPKHVLQNHQHIQHVHSEQTSTLTNSNEKFQINCHQAKESPTKKRRLTYHKLKKNGTSKKNNALTHSLLNMAQIEM